jgi:predicted hydrolase (HD superfamily)
MIARSKKVMFLETETGTFARMKGFTSMTINKNAKEYTRQYVDEDFEVTDITGISTSIDYAFDQIQGNDVHDKLIEIINEEFVGEDAVVVMLAVDFTDASTPLTTFNAVKRTFAVIPATEGDSLDAYTYGGTFRVKTERVKGTATTTDKWQTATFVPTV